MKRFLRHNGLSLTMLVFFLGTLAFGQFLTGLRQYNREREDRGQEQIALGEYWRSPHFIEATTENWESEFFQMFIYVVATVLLTQKGSAESNDPDAPDRPEPPLSARSPWAARKGGWIKAIYSHSLSLAFLALFSLSFVGHAWSGVRLLNEEEMARGEPPITIWQYVCESRFWFESFQNWQSEFLAIGSMVILSVFLRERGSPESKPVNLPHAEHEA